MNKGKEIREAVLWYGGVLLIAAAVLAASYKLVRRATR